MITLECYECQGKINFESEDDLPSIIDPLFCKLCKPAMKEVEEESGDEFFNRRTHVSQSCGQSLSYDDVLKDMLNDNQKVRNY